MSFLSNFKFGDNEMIFDVNNLNHSLLNSLRRLIITDIETLAFRTEYGIDSDIQVHKNTSSLHNEFLTHRISLVPIHYNTKEIHSFDKDKYEFYIEVSEGEEIDSIVDTLRKIVKKDYPNPIECRIFSQKFLDYKIKVNKILSTLV